MIITVDTINGCAFESVYQIDDEVEITIEQEIEVTMDNDIYSIYYLRDEEGNTKRIVDNAINPTYIDDELTYDNEDAYDLDNLVYELHTNEEKDITCTFTYETPSGYTSEDKTLHVKCISNKILFDYY